MSAVRKLSAAVGLALAAMGAPIVANAHVSDGVIKIGVLSDMSSLYADIGGPGSQLRVKTEDAPMAGRAESTYRYTVIDTIGGGASEIQKNIIARRGLGLPQSY